MQKPLTSPGLNVILPLDRQAHLAASQDCAMSFGLPLEGKARNKALIKGNKDLPMCKQFTTPPE